LRAYSNLCDELEEAGYSQAEAKEIKLELDRFLKLRDIIRNASGENLDLKAYEADMRHLLDTYIEADEPRSISPFGEVPLLDLIVKTGIADAINAMPKGLKGNKDGIAETIENNVRSKIIKEHLNDPTYYDKMSALLDEIIAARKSKALEYEKYLNEIAELAKKVQSGHDDNVPKTLNTPGRRALYNNLGKNEALALKIDEAVKAKRPHGWRGVQTRERVIKGVIDAILNDEAEVERIFAIIRQHSEY
jgi:type I restriction enzyme, R subunit